MEEEMNPIQKTEKIVEEAINRITEEGLHTENIDTLYKLIDIHKDIKNEKYWCIKEEKMRYYRDDYMNEPYMGRRSRDSRGRYNERGRNRGNYEGEDMIDEMREHYDNYMENSRYNGPEKEKSFDYMLKSAEDFFDYLMEEVENPEQMEKIRRTARKISEM